MAQRRVDACEADPPEDALNISVGATSPRRVSSFDEQPPTKFSPTQGV